MKGIHCYACKKWGHLVDEFLEKLNREKREN